MRGHNAALNAEYLANNPTEAMRKMVGALYETATYARGADAFDNSIDIWLIPDYDFMPKVLKHFGLSEENFLLAFKTYAKAFAQLWKYRSTGTRFTFDKATGKITLRSETPDKPDLVFTTRYIPGGPISFGRVLAINGFISNDYLNGLIKNYKRSEVPADWAKFGGTLHLHSSVLPRLYEELGVDSADEIFGSVKDYKDFDYKFMMSFGTFGGKYLPTGQYQFNDGQVVDILGRNKSGYPDVSDMPDLLKRELRKNIENRKNPAGKIFPHKDIFDLVVPTFKGRDLILACNADKATNKRCAANNYQVFRVKLLEEFDLDFNENDYGYPDAKSLYMQMYTVFAYAVVSLTGEPRIAPVKGYRLTFEPERDASLTIIIPLYIPARKGDWKPLKEFYVMDYRNDMYDTLTIDWQDEARTTPLRVTYNGPNDFLRTDEFLERIRFVRTETDEDFRRGLSIVQLKPARVIGFLREVHA